MTATPRRVSFLHPLEDTSVSSSALAAPVHGSDRDISSTPSLRSIENLPAFIYEHSTLNGLKKCSRRQTCDKRLCRYCSVRKATTARADLRQHAAPYAKVLTMTLSVASAATLEQAWSDLAAARKAFAPAKWLTPRSTFWYRQTEVTESATGWHLHDGWLVLGDPDDLAVLLEEVLPRWLTSAHGCRLQADPRGQHAALTRRKASAISYIAKGLMAQKSAQKATQGRTPGDLLALFHAGDAEAAARWEELESAFKVRGRRWVERSRAPRKADMGLCA